MFLIERDKLELKHMSGSGRIICITSWHHTYTHTHAHTHTLTHRHTLVVGKYENHFFHSLTELNKKKHQLRELSWNTTHSIVAGSSSEPRKSPGKPPRAALYPDHGRFVISGDTASLRQPRQVISRKLSAGKGFTVEVPP